MPGDKINTHIHREAGGGRVREIGELKKEFAKNVLQEPVYEEGAPKRVNSHGTDRTDNVWDRDVL